jgi:hypothetical protein
LSRRFLTDRPLHGIINGNREEMVSPVLQITGSRTVKICGSIWKLYIEIDYCCFHLRFLEPGVSARLRT